MNYGEFKYIIQKHIGLSETDGFHLTITYGKKSISSKSTTLMLNLYENYGNEDGFLRMEYTEIKTFG